MSEDWPQIKARLERFAKILNEGIGGMSDAAEDAAAADIRAALKRVEFWETANKRMSDQELEAECKSCAALRQRVNYYEAGLKRGEDYIREHIPDAPNGAFIIDVLRQRVEELESSDRESIEMYRRCRERAEAAEAKLREYEARDASR